MWVNKKWLPGAAFFLILVSIFSIADIQGQSGQSFPTRQSSIDAFTKGNYEEAYNNFSLLLEKYPKDPLYKYYSGASLVMLRRDTERALLLLDQSVNGASVVKSLPPEAFFFLGRAQQLNGKFTEAIESYNTYTGEVGKKAAREQGVPGYVQECENRKGMQTAPAQVVPAAAAATATVRTETADQPGKGVPVKDVNQTAEKPAGVREILPAEYEALLDEGLKLQYKADSLNKIAGDQKQQLDKLPDSEKSAMRVTIYQTEMLAASYQKSADAKYSEAQSKMDAKHATVPQKQDTMAGTTKQQVALPSETKKVLEAPAQPAVTVSGSASAVRAVGVTSVFEVLAKGAAYPDEKVLIDPVVPSGLIYRIQLAVFRNPVPVSFFKGITPVYGFRVQGSDKTNYYAGMFRKSVDAKKALNQVKETGFRDAFIIALADGKPVSSDRAAVMENEWGSRPFVDTNIPGAVTDTIPPTLAFRVEIARSVKPLKPDAVEALKTTAGSRGLDIIHLTDGNIVYLIGKFITFESAAEYADLLVRNNFRGARVVAWLGNKEIPVETARQLFKDLQ